MIMLNAIRCLFFNVGNFLKICLCVCVYAHVYTICVWVPAEGILSHGAVVTGSCELFNISKKPD